MTVFSKKYVFETRYTRNRRVFRNMLLVGTSMLMALVLLAIYMPIYAKKQKELAQQIFFEKAPDVIAVFTGDSGRIAYTLNKAKNYPSAKVFISGVYARNNLRILLEKQGRNLSVDDFIQQESHHVELDYLARNTVENGISTLNYLQRNPEYKNILIISSDYHMLRISLIMNTLTDDKNYQFFFDSVKTDYSNLKNIKKLIKEVYKLLKTSTFLLFWDRETTAN
jgi:uncharacterized SAM-binding protein YcdF (DUF218 family)